MLTMTRSDAFAHAKYVFATLAMRAWEVAGDDAEYVRILARTWQERLDAIGDVSGIFSDRERRTLDRLTSAVAHPKLTRDAMVEWVDALPSAIVDLFGSAAVVAQADLEPSIESTFAYELESDEPELVTAGNRQPALALAA